MITKKQMTLIFSAGLMLATTAQAKPLDLHSPEGATAAMRKVQCSTIDEKPIYYWWVGKVFSRRMGEPDQHLFNVEGMNVRTCGTVDGGKRGESFRMVSREVMLYTDPKTGEPLEQWNNPWTNETLEVLHVLNDPVNMPPRFNRDEQGKPLPHASRFIGEQRGGYWWFSSPIPLFYHNVLAGDYQRQIGGIYHATEMFNFSGDLASLTSPDTDTADVHVGWVRISDWLPWMMMQGREGMIYIHAAGRKVDSFDELGDVMKHYIDTQAPKYREPPPVNDVRPNATSWTTYKDDVPGEAFRLKR